MLLNYKPYLPVLSSDYDKFEKFVCIKSYNRINRDFVKDKIYTGGIEYSYRFSKSEKTNTEHRLVFMIIDGTEGLYFTYLEKDPDYSTMNLVSDYFMPLSEARKLKLKKINIENISKIEKL